MIQNMIKTILGGDIFQDAVKILSKGPFEYPGIKELVNNIYNVAMSFAVCLLIVYFLLKLVEILSSENFTWEQLWKQMAMFMAAKILMDYGMDIVVGLFNLGTILLNSLGSVAKIDTSSLYDAALLEKQFSKSLGLTGVMKVLEGVLMFVYLLIPWIVAWALSMCVKIICYTRLIEIALRASFAPLALSDFFHSGLQGTGWRFLKNFFAVCLQGAVILAIAMIYSKMFSSIIVGGETNILVFSGLVLAYSASAVMLMFKSLSFTKELVGSN